MYRLWPSLITDSKPIISIVSCLVNSCQVTEDILYNLCNYHTRYNLRFSITSFPADFIVPLRFEFPYSLFSCGQFVCLDVLLIFVKEI